MRIFQRRLSFRMMSDNETKMEDAAASLTGMMSMGESLSIASALLVMMLIATPLNMYVSRALHQMSPAVKRSLIDYVMMYSSTMAAIYAITVLPVRIANILAFLFRDAFALSRRISEAAGQSRFYDAALNGTLDFGGAGLGAGGRLAVTGAGRDGEAVPESETPETFTLEGLQKNATFGFALESGTEGALRYEVLLAVPGGANESSSPAQPPFLDVLCWSNYVGDSFFMAVLSNLMLVTPVIRFLYVFFPVLMLGISVRVSSRRLLAVVILAAVGYTVAAARNPNSELMVCVNRGSRGDAAEGKYFLSHLVGVLGGTGLNIGLNVSAYSSIAIYLACFRRKPGRRSILEAPRQSFHVVPLVVNLVHIFLYIITSSIGITFAFFVQRPQTESLYLHLSHILVLAFFMLLSPCALLFGCQRIRRRFKRDFNTFALSRISTIPSWPTGRLNTVSVALVDLPPPTHTYLGDESGVVSEVVNHSMDFK